MRIRRATADDVAVLSAFGRRVFGETFAPANNPEDLRAYLDSAYVETKQEDELRDPRIDTLLLQEGDALIAFAQLREGPPGNGVTSERPIELWRFYVDFAWHGRGVAQELMAAVEEAARSRGAGTLWLGVWERNERAQAFYRKHGFRKVSTQVFVVGTDPQTDHVMLRGL